MAPMSKSLDAGVYGFESPSAEKKEEKRREEKRREGEKYVSMESVKQWNIEHYYVLRLLI